MDDDDGPDLPMLVAEAKQGRQDAWDCIVGAAMPFSFAWCAELGHSKSRMLLKLGAAGP